jgi:hypothetical protein
MAVVVDGQTPRAGGGDVQQLGATADPASGAPAAPKMSLEQVKCELAVNTQGAKLLDLQDKIVKAKDEHKQAEDLKKQAQAEYDHMERAGSTGESAKFGMKYLRLRQKMKQLVERNKKDNQFKLKFVQLHSRIPVLQKTLDTATNERSLLDETNARLTKQIGELQHEKMLVKKKNQALSNQFPYSAQILDSKYADHLIPAKTEDAKLRLELDNAEKVSAETQKDMMPLAKSLKSLSGEVSEQSQFLHEVKAQVRGIQKQTINANDEMQTRLVDLRLKLKSKNKELEDAVSAAMEKRRAAREQSEQSEEKSDAAIEKSKVDEEQKQEQKIEEVEESGDQQSIAVKAAQAQQKSLINELAKLKASANKLQTSAEEDAAKQLEAIHVMYRKRLQEEKVAAGDKVVVRGSTSEVEQQRQEVEKTAEELRKKIPAVEEVVTPQ